MKEEIQNYFKGNYVSFYSKYLQNVKRINETEYITLCPFPSHNDTKPSFCFNNQTGQYYCHGCNKKGDVFHFYAKINDLNTKRDFSKVLKGIVGDFGIPWEEKKSHIVKTYDYTDAEGDLLFQVCRMDPKDFRQRRPNGNGGWVWNLKGIDPVLYRLPDVQKAKELIIVEGEKDTDTIKELGFDATTSPMGAKKWRDTYNEALKGKDVVLIPDKDNEGREHMTQVAISLNGTAKSLKWIELPDLPSKGDVSDWAAKFNDKTEAGERLAVMIENADLYEPPKKVSLEDIIITSKEFSAIDLPEKQGFLMPWLKENSINLIYGWRGYGKTWMALGVLDAVSDGKTFGPWQCKASVPCLFLDGEMHQSDTQERIVQLKLNRDRKNPLFIYSDAQANEYGLPRANLVNPTWRTKIKSILLTRKIKLWVIDNLASVAGGIDENSKKDWDPINQWLLELRFAGIATVLLHHTNKEGGQRGTSGREDNIDVSMSLKLPNDYTLEDGARFIAHFTKARVPTADLPLISDIEFKIIEDDSGLYSWTHRNVRKERKREILKMLDDGMDYNTIVDNLGVAKSYITKVKKQAIKDGHLTAKEKLTQSGFMEVSEL